MACIDAMTFLACASGFAGDIPVFVGGTIPAEDRATLMDAGVVGIFTAEMRLDDVVSELARKLAPEQAA